VQEPVQAPGGPGGPRAGRRRGRGLVDGDVQGGDVLAGQGAVVVGGAGGVAAGGGLDLAGADAVPAGGQQPGGMEAPSLGSPPRDTF